QHNAPRLTLTALAQAYRLNERAHRLKVRADSPLVGQKLDELALRKNYGINAVAVERQQKFRTLLLTATGNTIPQAGDVLLVDLTCPTQNILQTYNQLGLEPQPLPSSYFGLHAHELGL